MTTEDLEQRNQLQEQQPQAVDGDNNPVRVKQTRRRLNNGVKSFLEQVFITHPSPNRKERELIAKKCGVSPLQIRVWFTNKRMRWKHQIANNNANTDTV
ncbi:Mating-type-like protein A1 [Spathaspora sp. JA1]|nr:Mating-type-like protein A1 [Spathaspora sp. JA1]